MAKVTALGGIFFKCKDPIKLNEWYEKSLGIKTESYGATFEWRQAQDPSKKGFSVLGTFKESTDYFDPSRKEFMINFRVDNLDEILGQLKENGVMQIGETEMLEYGRFAHVLDPEGNKLELWEAVDNEYEKLLNGKSNF